jgi:hypothetical protein
MAALAILTLFLVPILGAVSKGLQFVSRAQGRTLALRLCQDKLAEVEMMTLPESEGTEEGDFGRDFSGYRWQVETIKTPLFQILEQQFPNLKGMEVHVRVFWDEDGVQRSIQLDSVLMG